MAHITIIANTPNGEKAAKAFDNALRPMMMHPDADGGEEPEPLPMEPQSKSRKRFIKRTRT